MSEPDNQPDELGQLSALVKEFTDKLKVIDHELETLKEDRKQLLEDYSDRLDIKTLKAAMRVVKIQSEQAHRGTFDNFVEVLETTI